MLHARTQLLFRLFRLLASLSYTLQPRWYDALLHTFIICAERDMAAFLVSLLSSSLILSPRVEVFDADLLKGLHHRNVLPESSSSYLCAAGGAS